MPCFHPLKGWRNRDNPRAITFKLQDGYVDRPMTVPCGQCIGCRVDKKRQWATRLVHEASLYKDNCFITLTYSDDNLPTNGSLNKKHFQDFMKRLRKANTNKIRYYHCGEYGEKYFRPHYHAILFNHDFSDKQKLEYKGNLFTSQLLTNAWHDKGFATIGDVTLESAAYVAGYVQKKVTGKNQNNYYRRFDHLDEQTGELVGEFQLQPEYSTMSRRPGIASDWFDKYHTDIYKDFVTIQGKKQKIPKYYDNKLYELNPELSEAIKSQRLENAKFLAHDNTPERLAVKKQILKDRMSQFKRKL